RVARDDDRAVAVGVGLGGAVGHTGAAGDRARARELRRHRLALSGHEAAGAGALHHGDRERVIVADLVGRVAVEGDLGVDPRLVLVRPVVADLVAGRAGVLDRGPAERQPLRLLDALPICRVARDDDRAVAVGVGLGGAVGHAGAAGDRARARELRGDRLAL